MAVSAGAPPGVEAELASDPDYVQAVSDGEQPVALSDYLDLGKGGHHDPALRPADPVRLRHAAAGDRLRPAEPLRAS